METDKFIVHLKGNCLAPIGLLDNTDHPVTRLHGWETTPEILFQYVGSVVAVAFTFPDGSHLFYMKVLAAVDTLNKEIWLTQLNPKKTYRFALKDVTDIMFVEDAKI